MIKFWAARQNLSWLKGTAGFLSAVLLFTFVAPPFAQAGIWEQRQEAAARLRQKEDAERSAFQPARPMPGASTVSEERRLGFTIPRELGAVTEIWEGESAASDA